jgi:hypothetical protein
MVRQKMPTTYKKLLRNPFVNTTTGTMVEIVQWHNAHFTIFCIRFHGNIPVSDYDDMNL